jgi:hypothetical protein
VAEACTRSSSMTVLRRRRTPIFRLSGTVTSAAVNSTGSAVRSRSVATAGAAVRPTPRPDFARRAPTSRGVHAPRGVRTPREVAVVQRWADDVTRAEPDRETLRDTADRTGAGLTGAHAPVAIEESVGAPRAANPPVTSLAAAPPQVSTEMRHVSGNPRWPSRPSRRPPRAHRIQLAHVVIATRTPAQAAPSMAARQGRRPRSAEQPIGCPRWVRADRALTRPADGQRR